MDIAKTKEETSAKGNSSSAAYLVVLGGLVLAGFTSPLLKVVSAMGMPPNAISFYRLSISALVLWPVVLSNKTSRAEIKSIGRRDYPLLIAGGCMMALDIFLWTTALNYSPVFLMSAIINLGPVWVIIASYIFLREKTPLRSLGGVVICLIGVSIAALSGMSDEANNPIGILMVVCASILNALTMICNRYLRRKLSVWPLMCLSFTFGSILMFLLSLLSGTKFGPYSLMAFGMIALIGIVCTLLRQAANIWVLKHIPATNVSLISLTLTYISGIIAFLLLGEIPGWGTVVGAVITTIGLYLYFKAVERVRRTSL